MSKVSKREVKMRFFVVHLVVYIMVNALLAAINYMFSPNYMWFFYALIPWGIGLVLHFLFTFLGQENEAAKSKSAQHQKAFIIHLVFYLMVNGFLAVINMMFTPEVLWVVFPAIGWGIGVAIHFIVSFFWVKD